MINLLGITCTTSSVSSTLELNVIWLDVNIRKVLWTDKSLSKTCTLVRTKSSLIFEPDFEYQLVSTNKIMIHGQFGLNWPHPCRRLNCIIPGCTEDVISVHYGHQWRHQRHLSHHWLSSQYFYSSNYSPPTLLRGRLLLFSMSLTLLLTAYWFPLTQLK